MTNRITAEQYCDIVATATQTCNRRLAQTMTMEPTVAKLEARIAMAHRDQAIVNASARLGR